MAKKILKLIRDYYIVIKNAPKDKFSQYETDLIQNLTEKDILYKPLSSITSEKEIKQFEKYLNFRIPFYQMILKLKKEDLQKEKEKFNISEISYNLTLSTIINKLKSNITKINTEIEKEIKKDKKNKKKKKIKIQ